jgi:hypothetical protein
MKDKAKEIYCKYIDAMPHPSTTNIETYIIAKRCALIAVDEIIKEIDNNYDTLHSADRKQYWKGIKKEIENL